jgi:hypothetical protein
LLSDASSEEEKADSIKGDLNLEAKMSCDGIKSQKLNSPLLRGENPKNRRQKYIL